MPLFLLISPYAQYTNPARVRLRFAANKNSAPTEAEAKYDLLLFKLSPLLRRAQRPLR